MRLYINAQMSAEGLGLLLERFNALQITGVRTDVAYGLENLTAQALGELKHYGFHNSIFLVAGGHMECDHDELVDWAASTAQRLLENDYPQGIIEVGNEPDLAIREWAEHPRALGAAFIDAYQAIQEVAPGMKVLTPSVSNLNERGTTYLQEMFKTAIPSGAGAAFHRYPNGDGSWRPSARAPHEGFASRQEEVMTLQEAVGFGRDLWLTETGFREGPYEEKKFLGLKKEKHWIREQDVAELVRQDMEFWLRVAQLQTYTYYGLNDGPDRDNPEDSYGIRHFEEPWDGPWKKVAQTLGEMGSRCA